MANEFVRARAPIPALGAIGRVYVMRNTPITFEFTAFKMPEDLVRDYNARLVDIDIYGTYNVTEAFGVNVGYRSMDLSYIFDRDAGNLRVDGVYFSGAFRILTEPAVSLLQRFISLAEAKPDLRAPESGVVVEAACGHDGHADLLDKPAHKRDVVAHAKVVDLGHDVVRTSRSVAPESVPLQDLQ